MGVAEGVARIAQLLTIALLGRVLGPARLGIVGVARRYDLVRFADVHPRQLAPARIKKVLLVR